jgi:hypothetical protein
VAKTLDDAEGQAERLDTQTGISGYYRRVLTGRESRLWHHQNPDMATWRRKVIIEETATAADSWRRTCALRRSTGPNMRARF